MSAPASEAESNDPLDLTTLDADSLFNALTAVDKAIPELLLSVKPVLAHLVSPSPTSDDEAAGIAAREGVERYMNLLDKIQFVLRQTVYYLRETKASTSTLRPPLVDAIPTPFASTLPGGQSEAGDVELGLYGSRLEARTLKEMAEALRRMRQEQDGDARKAEEDGKMSVDGDRVVDTVDAG